MTFLLYISTITTIDHPNFINVSKLHVACDQQIPTPNWKIGQRLNWNGTNTSIGMGPGMHHPRPCLHPILTHPVLTSSSCKYLTQLHFTPINSNAANALIGPHQQNVKPLDIAWCSLKPLKSPWNPLFPDHLWKQGISRAFKGFQRILSYVKRFDVLLMQPGMCVLSWMTVFILCPHTTPKDSQYLVPQRHLIPTYSSWDPQVARVITDCHWLLVAQWMCLWICRLA